MAQRNQESTDLSGEKKKRKRKQTCFIEPACTRGGRTSFSRNWLTKLCKNRRAVKNGWNVINLMFGRLFLQL